MNLLQIRYFVSVAENMSFTKASQELYVSQSTISKQIASLEEELGVNLFYRNGKTITVTPAGELLYHEFVRIIKEIDAAAMKAKSLGVGLFGELRVGFLQFMDIRQIAPGLIHDFVVYNPNIRLDMLAMRRKELQRAVLDGSVDCGFLLSFEAEEVMMSATVVSMSMPRYPHRLLYPRTMLRDKPKEQLTIRDFKDENFIFLAALDMDSKMNKTELSLLDEVDITPKKIYWVDSVESMLLYVEEGLGVAVLGPASRIQENKYVCSFDLPGSRSLAGLSFCWKRTNTNPALPIFIERLKASIRTDMEARNMGGTV